MVSQTDAAPARGDLVFLYGTLRPGGRQFRRLGLAGRLAPDGPAAMAGTLYDLGAYPGLVLEGRGRVRGQTARLLEPDIVPALDAYQGFDPADPAAALFRRVRAPLLGRADSAWVYIYARDVAGRPAIVSGRWMR